MATSQDSAIHPRFKKLNPAQLAAVRHGDGPLLVLAGAGTGKTMTLAHRVAYLILKGIKPECILLLTFTRKAAKEMIDRVGRIVGRGLAKRVVAGTFHSIGLKLLRRYAPAVSLRRDFTVMDQADAADLLNLVRTEQGHAEGETLFPKKGTLIAVYSRMINGQRRLDEVLNQHFPDCARHRDAIAEIFEGYVERKRAANVADFDDLLLMWRMLSASPQTGAAVAQRFDHILVDEYQDTCVLQNEILVNMHRHCKNIFAVGDDHQAIYQFREATIENILNFTKSFPGAHIAKIEQNYRSHQHILDVANTIMDVPDERYRKQLWSARKDGPNPVLVACDDENEQATYVVDRVLEHREDGTPLAEQVVLFRASHNANLLELELSRRGVPFVKYGGIRFAEAAHVKDLVAIIRVLTNPHDEVSWHRVLQLLAGIGPGHAKRIIDTLTVRKEGSSPVQRLIDDPPTIPAASHKQFDGLRNALADCSGSDDGGPVGPQIGRLRTFYTPILESKYDNIEARQRDLDTLEEVASRYTSRGDFISELSLDPIEQGTRPNSISGDSDDDILKLSTVHSFKGGEADIAYLISANDGMLPSSKAFGDAAAMDEERRITYVAVTRPRHQLYVSYCARQLNLREHRYAAAHLSRFLADAAETSFERQNAHADDREAEDFDECLGSVTADARELWR